MTTKRPALYDAIQSTNLQRTENGAKGYSTSLNKIVDLFFVMGGSRGRDISSTFLGALNEDPDLAVRCLLYLRDAREGVGERQQFRDLFKVLAKHDEILAVRAMRRLPELGRWDDLSWIFENCPQRMVNDEAVALISEALDAGNGLCAKWMPRQGKLAASLRSVLGCSPKSWRKRLVGLTNVVEQQMCAGKWNEIEYAKVPSVAAARYQKAFGRHDPVGYGKYADSLAKGEAKINAGAVFPYDVLRSLSNGNAAVADAQWKALPDFLADTDEAIMPVVDVSGSMTVSVAGSVTAMDVAISLGLYLSERNNGMFKDHFITFSTSPAMELIRGKSLSERVTQLRRANWSMSTNIEAVFDLILNAAVAHGLPQSDLPTKLLIISDMEFNSAVGSRANDTLFQTIERKFEKAGYVMPQLVFWNVNSRTNTIPVQYNKAGVALVSGMSAAIAKSVLGGKLGTPAQIVQDTVNVPRYNY